MTFAFFNRFVILGVLFACLMVPAHAAVNDALARRWVARGFLGLNCTSPAAQESDLSKRFADPAAVQAAWRFLKKCRDDHLSNTQEIVAAENYLFIRYVAGSSGDTGFKLFPWSYYLLKVAGSKADFLQKLQSNPGNPVSDPDPDVRKWGNQGYDDGIKDYEARTGHAASLKTASADVAYDFLWKLVYGQ